MSTLPDDPQGTRAARDARAARRRTPSVWLAVAVSIAAVFLVVFLLAWLL
jgi:hypothetical protein